MSSQTDQRLVPWIAVPTALLVLYLGAVHTYRACRGETVGATVPSAEMTDDDAQAAARIVAGVVRGEPARAPDGGRLAEESHGVYVGLRQEGQLRGEAWHMGGTVAEALEKATAQARGEVRASLLPDIDHAEVCIAHTYRRHRVRRVRDMPGNIHRGVRGVELRYQGEVVRYSPTQTLAMNVDFDKALERTMQRYEIGPTDLAGGDVDVREFECEQLLVRIADEPGLERMFRGNQIVELEDVARQSVGELERSLGDWLLRNLQPNGRMTYKWWPSRGQESPANNMIRQWMASIALVRIGNYWGDADVLDRAFDNIRYNLAQFYREENGFGLIEFRGNVKLGSVALAALAIMEHPRRAELAEFEHALRRTTFELQKESGRFRTFYEPKDADRNHNFYPGEALLYWALLYEREPSQELLERIMRSMRYYRGWHLENRNPAFIPWHTQAYVTVWMETRDDELRDWVFEMNDWLLGVQEWDGARYPDTRGRFYDDERPFGPPHASSTGVYLEGLIDAYRLAVEVGDDGRALRYRTAIIRGLRSIMQLQFADEIDMYYIHQRDRVRGGMRTTVYDNTIRVDNVQHVLLGIFRIWRTFSEADYRL